MIHIISLPNLTTKQHVEMYLESLSDPITELILKCLMFGKVSEENVGHWCGGLKGHIKSLSKLKIKGKKPEESLLFSSLSTGSENSVVIDATDISRLKKYSSLTPDMSDLPNKYYKVLHEICKVIVNMPHGETIPTSDVEAIINKYNQ
ncbi:MAG: hypothetical protein PHC38_10515 [Weeksellaceae bacterium]|nr:hypothetical protein [Weeksellaceae bacterium]